MPLSRAHPTRVWVTDPAVGTGPAVTRRPPLLGRLDRPVPRASNYGRARAQLQFAATAAQHATPWVGRGRGATALAAPPCRRRGSHSPGPVLLLTRTTSFIKVLRLPGEAALPGVTRQRPPGSIVLLKTHTLSISHTTVGLALTCPGPRASVRSRAARAQALRTPELGATQAAACHRA